MASIALSGSICGGELDDVSCDKTIEGEIAGSRAQNVVGDEEKDESSMFSEVVKL